MINNVLLYSSLSDHILFEFPPLTGGCSEGLDDLLLSTSTPELHSRIIVRAHVNEFCHFFSDIISHVRQQQLLVVWIN